MELGWDQHVRMPMFLDAYVMFRKKNVTINTSGL